MEKEIKRQLNVVSSVHIKLAESCTDSIARAVELLIKCLSSGGKILLCGNGGSAADAQHLAAEFVGRYLLDRNAYPAIALTTDTSILTAVANDFGYDAVFARQVEALGRPGDCLIGISTSGSSENVIKAMDQAALSGLHTIALTGPMGSPISILADISITVESEETPRIQEAHGVIGHIICDLVEKALVQREISADNGISD
ncbi:D-sedoheptulose 7-phosphate isomerase [bacterium]|nr:D-sedoheptulose 7-phosphate isomerase [bacterium]